jgi:hypothetical protein
MSDKSLRAKVNDAAGVGQMLPEAFSAAYEALFVGTFRDGDVDGGGSEGHSAHPMSGRGMEVGRSDGSGAIRMRTSSGQVDTVGTKVKSGSGRSGGGKDTRKTSNQLRNERLLREKTKVDKRLRRMAREIESMLRGEVHIEAVRRCAGRCGRLGQADWKYCPNCSGPMAEVDGEGLGHS